MSTDDQGVTAEFATVRRGYDPNQVDQYITSLQASTRADVAACRERLAETETALASAKQREEAVHLMLVAATQTKEEMVAAAQHDVEEATDHARHDADEILAEAKREAFALVTDARTAADAALEEARREAEGIVAKALEEAQAIAAEPHLHVVAPIGDGGPSTEEQEATERRIAELSTTETEMEHRIEGLKAVAQELETRLAEFARGALGEMAEAEAANPQTEPEVAPTPVEEAPAAVASTAAIERGQPWVDEPATENRPLSEEELPPVVRKTWKRSNGAGEPMPAMAPVEEAQAPMEPAIADEPLEHTPIEEPIGHEGDADTEAAASLTNRTNAARGSFYSRRSAKLPRIGVEAGRGALAAVSAMRSHSAHLDDDDDDDHDGKEAGDFAAQSA
jgi:cell division septum initiation protein DivIVA